MAVLRELVLDLAVLSVTYASLCQGGESVKSLAP